MNTTTTKEFHIVLNLTQLELLLNVLGCVEAEEQEKGRDCAEITALAQHILNETA